MAEQYHRLFLRWEILRGYVPALVFTIICMALESGFFYAASTAGFVDMTVIIPLLWFSFPFSIAVALAIANGLVIVTLWMNVFEGSAYFKAGPDPKVRQKLYPLRILRTAALVLTPFAILLFTPYIVTADWFVNWISSVQAFQGSAKAFYDWAFGVSQIDGSTRFIISQLSATLATVVVAGLQLWKVRGTKNMLRTLRRRK